MTDDSELLTGMFARFQEQQLEAKRLKTANHDAHERYTSKAAEVTVRNVPGELSSLCTHVIANCSGKTTCAARRERNGITGS